MQGDRRRGRAGDTEMDEVVGEERQNGMNTHQLLRLSGHDEGIRQRRSCPLESCLCNNGTKYVD